jgi:hypothetical protein
MIRSERWASRLLRSPFSRPKANANCERVIGTIRRECLPWMIPLSEAHPRSILREWVAHYNGGRPHSALGPGVPGPLAEAARTSMSMDTGVRSCERNPCWAACTTSTPSRRRRRSRMEYGPLNRMAETTEVLKSGVAPAGGHVCGAQGVQREFGKGALDLRRFCSKPMCRWGRW